ncbi:MAG: hypothetical protein WDA20_07320 [Desulfuromonadales bacterium]
MPSSPSRPQESARKETCAAACPYRDLAAGVCRASFSALPLDQRRQSCYCDNENHDNCVLFLSRLLRASGPLTFGRQNRELGFK